MRRALEIHGAPAANLSVHRWLLVLLSCKDRPPKAATDQGYMNLVQRHIGGHEGLTVTPVRAKVALPSGGAAPNRRKSAISATRQEVRLRGLNISIRRLIQSCGWLRWG